MKKPKPNFLYVLGIFKEKNNNNFHVHTFGREKTTTKSVLLRLFGCLPCHIQGMLLE